jgi:hypothetical protein
MAPKSPKNQRKDLPKSQQIFRYWVELRDLRDDSVQNLPLKEVVRIHIPTKKNPPQLPNAHVIQVDDVMGTFEATSIDDLSQQLRSKYPDGRFERTLKSERDRPAEEIYWSAMEKLVHILAKAAVNDLFHEQRQVHQ